MQGSPVAEPTNREWRITLLDDARNLQPGVHHHVRHPKRVDPRRSFIGFSIAFIDKWSFIFSNIVFLIWLSYFARLSYGYRS